jgi:phospholipid/cholesterol/gamma-HCH transport system substrate-binding protein
MKKFYQNFPNIQTKVGFFTVIILAVLVFGYLWLSNRLTLTAQQEVKISFTDIMGLEVGDKTMFRGMEVGRVKSVEARKDDILVIAKIDRAIHLKEGAQFYTSDRSLMGGTTLNISQGEGNRIIDLSREQLGNPPNSILSLVGKAAATFESVNTVLAKLRSDDGLLDKSANLMDDAGSAARSVDALAGNAKAELTATLNRIGQLTDEVNKVVNSNADNVNAALSGTPQTISNINTTLDSLQVLSAKLSGTVNAVNNGKGTAGKLISDDKLYQQLSDSVANLDSLVQDIKAHPKKYVKFSIF